MKRYQWRGFEVIELEPGDLPASAYTHQLKVGEVRQEATAGKVTICIAATAVAILGPHGRLLGDSKVAYQQQHADDEVLFNACVFDHNGVECWFGDLNLTEEEGALQQVARAIGPIYVTPELPYRFEGLPGHLPREVRRFTEAGRR